MKLNVIMLCGPRSSGKSTLVRMLSSAMDAPAHYLRLVPLEGQPRMTLLGDLKQSGLASWRRINYEGDRAFEFIPECLNDIAAESSANTVFIEADADPNLRYAYPYDHRIFVMPAPHCVDEVFRSAAEAAGALKDVMDDTAAFASEIFGLFDAELDDSASFSVNDRGGVTEERLEITPAQMRRFVGSPLGAEIASRIQLQPDYHGLIESDIVLVNMGIGGTTSIVDRCIDRIQMLISRLSDAPRNTPQLFACDVLDTKDPLQRRLMNSLSNRLSL
jgi:energy-coupling factor transporter ATP-binding protein EcfA2